LWDLTVGGAKYTFLMGLPFLVGIASISYSFLPALYGRAYAPMAPVLVVAALLAIPNLLASAASSLLTATEHQRVLIYAAGFCGALDIALDFILTPSHGAVGAAIANGTAQTVASIAICIAAFRIFRGTARLRDFGGIALSGLVMACVVVTLVNILRGVPGLCVAVPCGAVTWFAMLRITRSLHGADVDRLGGMTKILPGRARPAFLRLLHMVASPS
jgi:O-antigen/teichoic acid export membrane protein